MTHLLATAPPSVLLLLVATACGSAVEPAGEGGGGGSSAPTTSSSTTSSSTSTGDPPARGRGLVEAHTYGYFALQDVRSSRVQASYTRPPARPVDGTCDTREVDRCVVRTCPISAGGTIDPETLPTSVDAGVVTLRGGAREVSLVPSGASYPPDHSITEELFAGGEILAFDVAGSPDVPAHGATLVAPGRVTVVAPSLVALEGQPLRIPRDAPLPVEWTGATPGDHVDVVVFTREDVGEGETGTTVTVRCTAVAAGPDGELVIPASALADLVPSAPGVTSRLLVSTIARAEIALDGFDVELIATSNAIDVDGTLAEAEVVVE